MSKDAEAYADEVVFDDDNPEWTAEDFARAEGPESLPPEVLAAFPRTIQAMARDKAAPKPPEQIITLMLDTDVLEGWKGTGAGWKARMSAALRSALETA